MYQTTWNIDEMRKTASSPLLPSLPTSVSSQCTRRVGTLKRSATNFDVQDSLPPQQLNTLRLLDDGSGRKMKLQLEDTLENRDLGQSHNKGRRARRPVDRLLVPLSRDLMSHTQPGAGKTGSRNRSKLSMHFHLCLAIPSINIRGK